MATRKKYDAVATIGEYTDKQTGEKKKRYATVGSVFENDEGRLSLKLDTIPIGPGWSGFIQFYDPKPYEGGERQSDRMPPERRASHGMPPAPAATNDDEEENLPF